MDIENVRVSEADKRAAEDHKNKGNNSFKSRNFQEAIDHYSNAIKLNPKESAYYSNRAACYLQLKK